MEDRYGLMERPRRSLADFHEMGGSADRTPRELPRYEEGTGVRHPFELFVTFVMTLIAAHVRVPVAPCQHNSVGNESRHRSGGVRRFQRSEVALRCLELAVPSSASSAAQAMKEKNRWPYVPFPNPLIASRCGDELLGRGA
jgi:hypothetical protein